MPSNKFFKKFNTGSLRHQVIIEDPPAGTGTRGERTGDWTELATVRASIEQLSGDEIVQAHQLVANATHRVTIRYTAGVSPEQRVKFGDRFLHVGAADNVDQLNRFIVLTCREEVA